MLEKFLKPWINIAAGIELSTLTQAQTYFFFEKFLDKKFHWTYDELF